MLRAQASWARRNRRRLPIQRRPPCTTICPRRHPTERALFMNLSSTANNRDGHKHYATSGPFFWKTMPAEDTGSFAEIFLSRVSFSSNGSTSHSARRLITNLGFEARCIHYIFKKGFKINKMKFPVNCCISENRAKIVSKASAADNCSIEKSRCQLTFDALREEWRQLFALTDLLSVSRLE